MAEALQSPLLEGIAHGFSCREGLAAGDILPGADLAMVRQVHSPDVVAATGEWGEDPPEADALVTATRGLALGIVTADCAPVLLADRQANVIGAAHAGWRGALGGVIENTVAAMEKLGARRDAIVAAIGPCIAPESYEVGEDFHRQFKEIDALFFAPGRPGHWQFDLPSYVLSRLREAGVGAAEWIGRDTYGDAAAFHSYRRATHRGEPTGGRQISLIALR